MQNKILSRLLSNGSRWRKTASHPVQTKCHPVQSGCHPVRSGCRLPASLSAWGVFISLLLSLSPLEMRAQTDDFVLGADLGWTTEYEHKGYRLFDTAGRQTEATALVRQYGITAVRCRVWVNPERHGFWCSKEDVLNKCLRAKALGMDVMVDFHYSDWWADPGKQPIPAQWSGHSVEQMCADVAAHTRDVLDFLRTYGIVPRWVQVGNETTNGLLWSVREDPATGWPLPDENGENVITEDVGRAQTHPDNYARLMRAGVEAVRQAAPEAKVIVHLDDGFDRDLYVWNLDLLRAGGVDFDLIGMSLYPYWAMEGGKRPTADATIEDCIANIRAVAERYGRDVLIVETGMDALDPDEGYRQLRQILRRAKSETSGRCRGVFYWEPCCRPSQYRLGAFTEDGRPTRIMDAFLDFDKP